MAAATKLVLSETDRSRPWRSLRRPFWAPGSETETETATAAKPRKLGFLKEYPLVNIQKTMENHHFFPFLMRQSTISMAILHSYVKLPEGSHGI